MKIIALIIFVSVGLLARAEDKLFDEALASNAMAVLRVRLLFSYTLDTNYTWYSAHTIQVYKNDSDKRIADLEIGSFKGRPGVPYGDCTVYLVPYNMAKREFVNINQGGHWFLTEGGSTNSVSHVKDR